MSTQIFIPPNVSLICSSPQSHKMYNCDIMTNLSWRILGVSLEVIRGPWGQVLSGPWGAREGSWGIWGYEKIGLFWHTCCLGPNPVSTSTEQKYLSWNVQPGNAMQVTTKWSWYEAQVVKCCKEGWELSEEQDFQTSLQCVPSKASPRQVELYHLVIFR